MSEESKWYFAKKGKPYGPFTEHELCKHSAAGSFGPNDHVFCKGEMDGWVKASTIPGLCDTLELDAEPEPEHHQVPFYERAAFEHAGDKKRQQKERKERDSKYWKKLDGK